MKRSAREQIQQKFDFYEVPAFDKAFRGYDAEAVDDYLSALVDAYTKMYAECEELRKAAEEYKLFQEKVAHILVGRESEALPAPAGTNGAESGPTEETFDVSKLVEDILNGRTITFDEVIA